MKTEIKYALIFVLASFLWTILEYLTGLHSTHIKLHPYITNIFVIVAVIIFIYAIRAKRDELGGQITFGKAFLTGFIISVIIVILSPLSLYIYSHYINPAFFVDFQKCAIESGSSTPEEAANFFNYKSYVMMSTGFGLGMGIITSLFIAIFIKKDIRSAK